jgi:hypothetical protein
MISHPHETKALSVRSKRLSERSSNRSSNRSSKRSSERSSVQSMIATKHMYCKVFNACSMYSCLRLNIRGIYANIYIWLSPKVWLKWRGLCHINKWYDIVKTKSRHNVPPHRIGWSAHQYARRHHTTWYPLNFWVMEACPCRSRPPMGAIPSAFTGEGQWAHVFARGSWALGGKNSHIKELYDFWVWK